MDHSIRLQSFRCLQAHMGLAMLQVVRFIPRENCADCQETA